MRSGKTPTRTAGRRAAQHRRAVTWLAVLSAPLLVLAGGLALEVPAPPGASAAVAVEPASAGRASAPPARTVVAPAPYLVVVGSFLTERRDASSSIGQSAVVLDAARAALADSAGRVLAESARTELAAGIRATADEVERADTAVDTANRLVGDHRTTGSYFSASADFVTATALLRVEVDDDLVALSDDLAAATQAVTDAVAAWQAEQERLAAEEAARVAAAEAARVAAESAAAEEAARETAAAGGGGSAGGASASPTAAGAATLDKHVWTSGFQNEIDACNGAVDVTARYGVAVIAEHWSCGGSGFPASGSVISLTGIRSGSYLVGGVAAVLNAHTQGTSDVPRGYDLLYQTCINGSDSAMSFTVLTRVG